jgi:hypothetical protein
MVWSARTPPSSSERPPAAKGPASVDRWYPFYANVGRKPAGSLRITIRAKNPKDRTGSYRQLAVCVYKLAAEMERRTEALGARWVVAPQVFDERIDVELGDNDDEQAAERFVTKVLEEAGLL